MTIVKFVTMWCDEPNCDNCVDTGEREARAARTWAYKVAHWAFRDGKDYCDQHAQVKR